jgi:hypothetical protein
LEGLWWRWRVVGGFMVEMESCWRVYGGDGELLEGLWFRGFGTGLVAVKHKFIDYESIFGFNNYFYIFSNEDVDDFVTIFCNSVPTI